MSRERCCPRFPLFCLHLSLSFGSTPPLLASLPATCWQLCVSSGELGQASARHIPVVLWWGMSTV